MKRIILTLLLGTFLSSGFAQETSSGTGKFHFGLKATPSLAWLHSDTKGFESNGSKFGFNYGLITDFNFAEHYAFSTGIDITYRGGESKYTFTLDSITTSFENTTTLQYIELPLTLKLKTSEIGYMTYFLQFGVAPGILIRAREDQVMSTQIGSAPVIKTEENDVDIQKGINNLNVSMVIAGGVEYNLSGNTNLLAAITFNNGFLDVLDDKDIKANSNYLGLTIGVLF